ncbi:MAG: protein-methionine-sulfoxide reductase heme-binding subunit MsrQ [Woeseiaceae bacterium]|nr:protein-methionine-sulfoxide reductase heme-binding subunit MsrQ [Woeseiaceae bacterium]
MISQKQLRFVVKPIVFVACLLPAALIVTDTFGLTGSLGANPIEEILDRFGILGIQFILIALAVTPLRQLTGWTQLARFRRMLGLFAFFYVFMHFLTWLVLDRGLAWQDILEDIVKRPFITIGMIALVLLIAMAATSFNRLRQRMGRRWQKLHCSVYAVGVLGVWHYWWQVKADALEPAIYASILTALLGYRVYKRRKRRNPREAVLATQ